MTETQNTPTDNYFEIYGFARPVKPVRTAAAQARRDALVARILADEAPKTAPEVRPTAAQYAAVAR